MRASRALNAPSAIGALLGAALIFICGLAACGERGVVVERVREPEATLGALDTTADAVGSERAHQGHFVVCGQRFPVQAPVVLFSEPGGYDAHDLQLHFARQSSDPELSDSLRYRPGRVSQTALKSGRKELAKESIYQQSLEEIRGLVDMVVIHFDACGSSARCFEVLHDIRGLSAHFLIDLDGTIYQTLDLRDTAWHAGPVNTRSIGIEIAHIGAFPERKDLERHYIADQQRGGVTYQPPLEPASNYASDFTARPARRDPLTGAIHGQELWQYDFTEEQYRSLLALSRSLLDVFPRLEARVPQDDSAGTSGVSDRVLARVFDADEQQSFGGFCGHWHVGSHKVDPGPAFDWQRFLRGL